MEILILQVFVSLILAASGVLLFLWSHKQGDPEHAERLSLIPMEHDEATSPAKVAPPAPTKA